MSSIISSLSNYTLSPNTRKKLNLKLNYKIKQFTSKKMEPLLISLITPTYNESKNILENIQRIQESLKNYFYEIIIVDDNSPDGCGKIADMLAQNYSNIKVMHRNGKNGLGTAYKEGFSLTSGNLIVSMDSDLSHDPSFLPAMIEEAKKTDIVIGSRLCKGGSIQGRKYYRDFLTGFTNQFIKTITRSKINDWTSGFRIYRRDTWEKLMPQVHCNKWDYQYESLYKAKKMGYTIKEVPITFYERSEGASKFGIKDMFVFIKSFFYVIMGWK